MPTPQACPRPRNGSLPTRRSAAGAGCALTARTGGPVVYPPPPPPPRRAPDPGFSSHPAAPLRRPDRSGPVRVLGMTIVVMLLFGAVCLFLFMRMTAEPMPPVGPPSPVVTMPANPLYPPAVRNPLQSQPPWPPGAGWGTRRPSMSPRTSPRRATRRFILSRCTRCRAPRPCRRCRAPTEVVLLWESPGPRGVPGRESGDSWGNDDGRTRGRNDW